MYYHSSGRAKYRITAATVVAFGSASVRGTRSPQQRRDQTALCHANPTDPSASARAICRFVLRGPKRGQKRERKNATACRDGRDEQQQRQPPLRRTPAARRAAPTADSDGRGRVEYEEYPCRVPSGSPKVEPKVRLHYFVSGRTVGQLPRPQTKTAQKSIQRRHALLACQ